MKINYVRADEKATPAFTTRSAWIVVRQGVTPVRAFRTYLKLISNWGSPVGTSVTYVLLRRGEFIHSESGSWPRSPLPLIEFVDPKVTAVFIWQRNGTSTVAEARTVNSYYRAKVRGLRTKIRSTASMVDAAEI